MPGAHLLKAGESVTQPDIWRLTNGEGREVVWKTFRESPLLARATICRWLVRREARNLAALKGMENVPEFLGCPEPVTIEMTFLLAEPVPERKGALTPAYFDQLNEMIAEMHARGLNHGDLRRKNLMLNAETGEPCLVDFAQSFYAKPNSVTARLVHPIAFRVDRSTFLHLKRWYLSQKGLTAEELAEARAVPWHLRLGRLLKKKVYRRYKHKRRSVRARMRRRHEKSP